MPAYDENWRNLPNPKSPLDLRHGDPERRVDDLGRLAFDEAVAKAATIATQAVAQVHRRRLVLQAGVSAFVASLGVALVMALALSSAADNTARRFALSNCHLITAIATPLANFVTSDATLRQKQAKLASEDTPVGQGFARLLGAKNYRRLVQESNAANAQTIAFWQQVVVPQLRAIAGADCQLRLP